MMSKAKRDKTPTRSSSVSKRRASGGAPGSPSSSASSTLKASSSWRFVDELWSLRDSHTDVRLICSEGESVWGHQALLALASPFLKRLFHEEGIREGKRDPEITVLLEDTSSTTLLTLLQLLYTGKAPSELSVTAKSQLEDLATMLYVPLPPLEPPIIGSPEIDDLEPITRCIHCGVKFERLRPLKKHLSSCQRAGATSQLLCLRSCSRPCNKKQHQVPSSPSPPPTAEEKEQKAFVKNEEEKVEEDSSCVKFSDKPSEPIKSEELTEDEGSREFVSKSTPPVEPKNSNSGNGKRKRPRGEGPQRKRGRKGTGKEEESSHPATGEHGCPLCENIYGSPSLLREHLCAHFKDELWLIIKGFSSAVTNCAICFKEFRKPVIKNVVVRHYGITHLYIKNYLDAEVFDEYFSGQKKAMEKRALKMKKQEEEEERTVAAPPVLKALPAVSSTLFARKSIPTTTHGEDGVIFSLGNEIRGFMDNEEGPPSGNGGPYAPPHYVGSRVPLEELYSSESSFDATYPPHPTPSCEDQSSSRRSSGSLAAYNYSDYYPLPPPPGEGGEFFQPPAYQPPNNCSTTPLNPSTASGFYSEHFFDGSNSYYPSPPVSSTPSLDPVNRLPS